jgi:hypothetical protein
MIRDQTQLFIKVYLFAKCEFKAIFGSLYFDPEAVDSKLSSGVAKSRCVPSSEKIYGVVFVVE